VMPVMSARLAIDEKPLELIGLAVRRNESR
jgi:hypothetical protein